MELYLGGDGGDGGEGIGSEERGGEALRSMLRVSFLQELSLCVFLNWKPDSSTTSSSESCKNGIIDEI